jgi:hypothetical protein
MPPSTVARLLREALHCVSHPLSRLESFRFLLSLPTASGMDQATLAGVLEATLQVCTSERYWFHVGPVTILSR